MAEKVSFGCGGNGISVTYDKASPETFKSPGDIQSKERDASAKQSHAGRARDEAEAGAARAWAAVPGASVCPRRGGRPRPLAPACAPPPAPTCTHPLACALARKPLSPGAAAAILSPAVALQSALGFQWKESLGR